MRYAEVALLAAVIEDDILTSSLRQMFIDPLDPGSGGPALAIETLRAYFAAERNAASAAAILGVSRQAVNGRLQAIAEQLGSPVNSVAAELELALRVRDFEASKADTTARL